ncbi:MAG: M48 family metalloprotease [Pseudomonadota bacterium]
MRIRLRTTIVASLFVVTACAQPRTQSPSVSSAELAAEQRKQEEIVVQDLVNDQRRLLSVGYPLLLAGADLCGDYVRRGAGFYLQGRDGFPEELRNAAERIFRFDGGYKIYYVAPGSPAAAAGLRDGDKVLSIDGKALPTTPEEMKKFREELNTKKEAPTSYVIERDGTEMTIEIRPVSVCDYELAVNPDQDVNAATDGETIAINQGMLRFVHNDDELALVVAHELAHDAMGHIDAQKQNAAVAGAGGLMLDILAAMVGVNTGGAFMKAAADAGQQAFSVEFEEEADYVGMYLMARAGYRIENAPDMWRRMAAVNPDAITVAKTHPTTPERFVALTKTIEEIDRKRETSIALMPEFKDRFEGRKRRSANLGRTAFGQSKADSRGPGESTPPPTPTPEP